VADSVFEGDIQDNPAPALPSPSFTTKTHSLGRPMMQTAGTYRLCYCTFGATIFGSPADCLTPLSYIMDAGELVIEGPDMKTHYTVRAGIQFDLSIFGVRFLHQDRVRVVPIKQKCGMPGANVTDQWVTGEVDGFRYLGGPTVSVWVNLTIFQAGDYHVCWCQGALGTGPRCQSAEDFAVDAGTLEVHGPWYDEQIIQMSVDAWITLEGRGLDSGDRIRIVDYDQKCAASGADTSARLWSPSMACLMDQPIA